jgi:8-oxo-dGTP pyrophosphatase MutT (NUDIX family)
MWVFPGGRVDPADADPDRPGDELAAARQAAAREATEEAGLVLDPAALVPFSHWTPPPEAPKRYLTWFFLALAPETEVEIDGGEIHEHLWLRPDEVLDRQAAGEIELAPPTWLTLRRIAPASDVEAALAEARSRPPERFETHIAMAGREVVAVWAGDAGYDDGDLDRPGPRNRLFMVDGGWRYELG